MSPDDVDALIEGSVLREEDRVRITAQLVRGATDEHLWAETYDRKLTAENIFAIQGDIAQVIAQALHKGDCRRWTIHRQQLA